jgi:hypothetical protein
VKGDLHRASSGRSIRVMVRTELAPALAAYAKGRGATMLRRMKDMPTGTIGFKAIGEVEDDDWEENRRAGARASDGRRP